MKKFLSVCLALGFVLNINAHNVFAGNAGDVSAKLSTESFDKDDSGLAKKVALRVGGLVLTVGAGVLLLGKCFGGSDNNQTNNSSNFSSPYDSFWQRLEPLVLSDIEISKINQFRGSIENVSVLSANCLYGGKTLYKDGIVDDELLRDLTCDGKRVAIIDASNTGGLGGGGVDGCIFRAMGTTAHLHVEKTVQPYSSGSRIHEGGAVIHSSCEIARRHPNVPYVVQAVSPKINGDPRTLDLLYSAYYNAVVLAIYSGCRKIVTPALGTGLFFQADDITAKRCADVALNAIRDARRDMSSQNVDVIFIDYNDKLRNESFFNRLYKLLNPTN